MFTSPTTRDQLAGLQSNHVFPFKLSVNELRLELERRGKIVGLIEAQCVFFREIKFLNHSIFFFQYCSAKAQFASKFGFNLVLSYRRQ